MKNQPYRSIRENCYITASGYFKERKKEAVNTKTKLGEFNLEVEEVELISHPASDDQHVTDNNSVFNRRYETLSNTNDDDRDIADNLELRSHVMHHLRQYFKKNHFTEIQTPTLVSSGHLCNQSGITAAAKKSAALKLSENPLEYHQLLMSAGFNRCYQIYKSYSAKHDTHLPKLERTKLDFVVALPHLGNIKNRLEKLITDMLSTYQKKKIQGIMHLTQKSIINLFGQVTMSHKILNKPVDITDSLKDSKVNLFKPDKTTPDKKVYAFVVRDDNFSRAALDKVNSLVRSSGCSGITHIEVIARGKGVSGLRSGIKDHMNSKTIEKILDKVEAIDGDNVFILADKKSICTRVIEKLYTHFSHDDKNTTYRPYWIREYSFPTKKLSCVNIYDSPLVAPANKITLSEDDDISTLQSSKFTFHVNQEQIITGACFNHDLSTQIRMFEYYYPDSDKWKKEYAHVLRALEKGCPPFANVTIDIDRLCMLLCDTKNASDLIAFPKTRTGRCHLIQGENEDDS